MSYYEEKLALFTQGIYGVTLTLARPLQNTLIEINWVKLMLSAVPALR